MPFARVPDARRCSSRSAWRSTELRGSPAHGVPSRRPHDVAPLRWPSCSVRRCSTPRPRPTRLGRSSPTSPVSCPAWGASIRARGDLGFEIRGRQDAALDRPHQLAGDVRSLRWRRHDDVGRPGGRMRRWSRSPTGRSTTGRSRRCGCWPELSDAVVAEVAGEHDVPARRPGALGDDGDDGLPLVRYGFVGGVAGERGPVVVMLDGELSGDVIDLDQLAAGDDHQRRAAPRRRRPDRRSRRCAGASSTCGRPRPSRPGSTSTRSSGSATASPATATAAARSPQLTSRRRAVRACGRCRRRRPERRAHRRADGLHRSG